MTVSASDIAIVLSGGPDNQNPAYSVGGPPSSFPVLLGSGGLFDDVSKAEVADGSTDYRCVYVFNDNDADALSDVVAYTEAGTEGGGVAQIGVLRQTEIQSVVVGGGASGGSFSLSYAGRGGTYVLAVGFDGQLGQWTANFNAAVAAVPELAGTVVTGQLAGAATVFLVTFAGDSDERFYDVFELQDNSLVGSPAVTVSRVQPGSPVNAIAPVIADEATAPAGVTFVSASDLSPLSVGTLHPNDGFPLWLKRVVSPNADSATGGFSLWVAGD